MPETLHSRRLSQRPVALYQRVKDYVMQQIIDGSLPPGARVPSEQQLIAKFGVARMTANRALRELSEQGAVVRLAGVGTFVAEGKRQSNLLQIASIAEEIQQRGHDHRFELLHMHRESASAQTASALQLMTGSSVFHLLGIHYENEVPVQLEERYVNPGAVPHFMQQDFSRIQPSDYLMRNVPFDELEHVVDAVLPSQQQAHWLQMPADQPCLLLTRRTWKREQVVTSVHCLHPGSRYRLGSRFRPGGPAANV